MCMSAQICSNKNKQVHRCVAGQSRLRVTPGMNRYAETLAPPGDLGNHVSGILLGCVGIFLYVIVYDAWVDFPNQFEVRLSISWWRESLSYSRSEKIRLRSLFPYPLWRAIYASIAGISWRIPWLFRSSIHGGGDQGELGERSTHPKPLIVVEDQGFRVIPAMADNHSETVSGG